MWEVDGATAARGSVMVVVEPAGFEPREGVFRIGAEPWAVEIVEMAAVALAEVAGLAVVASGNGEEDASRGEIVGIRINHVAKILEGLLGIRDGEAGEGERQD